MSKPVSYTEEANRKGAASNPTDKLPTDTLNPPKVSTQGKPTQRAVTSALQAHTIAKSLVDKDGIPQTGRIAVGAIVAAKYNGEQPFSQQALLDTGQDWRNNYSTNFLASVIDRVKPQLLDPLHKADLLTHSLLPPSIENGGEKSRKYQEVTTRTIRRWKQWRNFCSSLIQEVITYGVSTPGWIDHQTEWRPKLWRYDEAYFPQETEQHASLAVVGVFVQKLALDKFLNLIKDTRIADKAGYHVENCVKTANDLTGKGDTGEGNETSLQAQDKLREGGNLADSIGTKIRTVDLWHVIVQDYSGEVDLWTVLQSDGTEIRNVEGLCDGMDEATCFFTFQSGNGRLYGSKGLGRLLVNLHIAIERGRCLGSDQLYLSGLPIFKTKTKNAAQLQAKVRHPFIFVDSDLEILTEQVSFDVNAFQYMDQKLTTIADSIAGAFVPPNLTEQGANTKIEAAEKASREMAVKSGVLARSAEQFGDLVSTMQRKMYSPINLREGYRAWEEKKRKTQKGITVLLRKAWKIIQKAFPGTKAEPEMEVKVADEDAVAAVVELLEAGLSVEEIALLSISPSAQNNSDEGEELDAQTIQFINANRINPHIDQRKASELEANIVLGQSRARQLLSKEEDPNVEAVATRQQIVEMGEMMSGEAMPVAGTDRHDLHRKILAERYPAILQATIQSPTMELISSSELLIQHYSDHINADPFMPREQKANEIKFLARDFQALEKLKAEMQKAAAEAQAGGQPSPFNLPKPIGGTPLGGTPPGDPGAGGEMVAHPQDAAVKLELHKLGQKDAELDQKSRALDLQEKDMDHRHAKETIELQQKNAQFVADTAKSVKEVEMKNADREQAAILAARTAAEKAKARPDKSA